jgi:lipopolysaccharide export system protein LptA
VTDESEGSEDIIRFSSSDLFPHSIAYDMSKDHPKQIVEIDGRQVEFDEEKQQYVFSKESEGENP